MLSTAAVLFKFKKILVKRNYYSLSNRVSSHADDRANERLLKKLYKLVIDCFLIKDESLAYQAVDLIKLAIGKGIYREDESHYLKGLIISALRAKQFKISQYIIEAYKPLIKKNPSHYELVTRDLTVIIMLAFKYRLNYLASKAVEIIAKIPCTGEPLVNVLKISGILSIRSGDIDLFHDVSASLERLACADIVKVLVYWLSRIIKVDNDHFAKLWVELAIALLPDMDEKSAGYLFDEWQNFTCIACLNPFSKIRLLLAEQLLVAADRTNKTAFSFKAVEGVSKAARSMIERGTDEASIMIIPLLEFGKMLFVKELKFPNFNDGFRQKTLYCLMRQLVYYIEQVSRQNMSITPPEVIYELYEQWHQHDQSKLNAKNKKKFCQLLLLYWAGIKQRQAKKIKFYKEELNEPVLLNNEELKKFSFLSFGG